MHICDHAPRNLAEGDSNIQRFDRIIAAVTNKTKCMDGSLLWAESIREAFFETCRYLTLTAKNGIVINKKKILFCQKEVY